MYSLYIEPQFPFRPCIYLGDTLIIRGRLLSIINSNWDIKRVLEENKEQVNSLMQLVNAANVYDQFSSGIFLQV